MQKITCYDHNKREYQFELSAFIEREAIYGIYRKNEYILLVKDAKSDMWEIPGGGKNVGESDFACLQREFFEETGLTIHTEIYKYTEDVSYFYNIESAEPWKTLRKFYLVTTLHDNFISEGNKDDIKQVTFINKKNFPTIAMQKSTIDILSNI